MAEDRLIDECFKAKRRWTPQLELLCMIKGLEYVSDLTMCFRSDAGAEKSGLLVQWQISKHIADGKMPYDTRGRFC